MADAHQEESAALVARLNELAAAAGAATKTINPSCVEGTVKAIVAKWLLGGRQVVHAFRATLDADAREVRFRESAVESSWGLAPPTLTFTTSGQRGMRVTEHRTDTSVGGGGRLHYGQFREEVERAVRQAGWKFVLTVA